MDIGKDKPLVIEQGTPIWIPTYGIHNDSLFWDDAEIFKPERFFHHEHVAAKTKGIFLPFGDGPRMCIGKISFSPSRQSIQSILCLRALI